MVKKSSGYTIVEVLVTIVVGLLFIITAIRLYIVAAQISQASSAYQKADLLAYNNLRSYAYGRAPLWFECTISGGTAEPMVLISSSDPVDGIPGPVTQTVTATAPYGCGGDGDGSSNGLPIKVESIVQYGIAGKTIAHATYASY